MNDAQRPGPLVELEWLDSGGVQGWHEAARTADPLDTLHCISVGYLVEDSERGVVLAMGANAAGLHHDGLAVPRVNVVALHRLRRS